DRDRWTLAAGVRSQPDRPAWLGIGHDPRPPRRVRRGPCDVRGGRIPNPVTACARGRGAEPDPGRGEPVVVVAVRRDFRVYLPRLTVHAGGPRLHTDP